MDKETLLQFFNEHKDVAVEYTASKSAEVLVDDQQALNEIITNIDIMIEGKKEWQKYLKP